MQPDSIVNTVLGVFAFLMMVALLVGRLIGERMQDPNRALRLVALAAAGLNILLLIVVQPAVANVGVIVTWQTLLFGLTLAVSLLGGCATGVARRRGAQRTLKVIAVVATVIVGLGMFAFFSRVNQVMDFLRGFGLLQPRHKYEPDVSQDCPSNLRCLYIAFHLYAQDWDALPPAANWGDNEDLINKVSRNEWLHCPAVSNRHDDRYGYAYNDAAAGLKLHGKHQLADLPHAAQTPLLYDSSTLTKSAHDTLQSLPHPGRHNGRNTILYLDGHVQAVAP